MRLRSLQRLWLAAVPCLLVTGSPIHLMGDDTPSPAQLIHAAIAARHAQDEKGWRFTYREDQDQFEKDKKGVIVPGTRRTFDVIMLEGEPYRKLILLNGQPLDAKMQKRVEQEMEVARAERRKHKLGTITRSVAVTELESLEKLFDNRVTGEEEGRGRQACRM